MVVNNILNNCIFQYHVTFQKHKIFMLHLYVAFTVSCNQRYRLGVEAAGWYRSSNMKYV